MLFKLFRFITVITISFLLLSLVYSAFEIKFCNCSTSLVCVDDMYSFILPEQIKCVQKNLVIPDIVKDYFYMDESVFEGEEILYHLDLFQKKGNDIHGFLQLWKLNGTLEGFLSRGEENLSSNVYGLKTGTVYTGHKDWYKWEFNVKGQNNEKDTFVMYGFCQTEEKVIIFSLKCRENISMTRELFNEIMDSVIQSNPVT